MRVLNRSIVSCTLPNTLRNRRNFFLAFQSNGGKREASAKYESRARGRARKKYHLSPVKSPTNHRVKKVAWRATTGEDRLTVGWWRHILVKLLWKHMPTAQLWEIPINSDLHRVDLNGNGHRVNLILPWESEVLRGRSRPKYLMFARQSRYEDNDGEPWRRKHEGAIKCMIICWGNIFSQEMTVTCKHSCTLSCRQNLKAGVWF